MLKRLRRFGLRAIILTLAALAALNLTLLIAAAIFGRENPTDMVAPPIVRQAAAAAELMDRLPPEARTDAVAALSTPMLTFELLDSFDPPTDADPRPVFVPIVEAYQRRVGERRLRVYAKSEDALRGPLRTWLGLRPRARLSDRIVVVLALADGGALAVEGGEALRRRIAVEITLIMSAACGLVLIGLLIWTSFSYGRPLDRLSRASERFARDLDAPPMPETGPEPVRDLSAALNRMQESLRQLVEDRTRTLSAIAHDLRTYLTRLRMRAEFIEPEIQREKALADLSDMTELLNDALALSAKPETRPERLDLRAYLEARVRRRAEAGQAVTLCAETPAGPLWVEAPRLLLDRAVDNLIENGLRYAGAAELSFEQDGPACAILVRDRGPGAPPELLDQLAKPFFRLERSRSRETGGAGLGLAIAKAMIERAGGALSLSNRAGGGFEARLSLPVAT